MIVENRLILRGAFGELNWCFFHLHLKENTGGSLTVLKEKFRFSSQFWRITVEGPSAPGGGLLDGRAQGIAVHHTETQRVGGAARHLETWTPELVSVVSCQATRISSWRLHSNLQMPQLEPSA